MSETLAEKLNRQTDSYAMPTTIQVLSITIYFVIWTLTAIYLMYCVWLKVEALLASVDATLIGNIVATTATNATAPLTVINEDGAVIPLIPDSLAVMAVVISGTLGGLVHGIRSFYYHYLQGDLMHGWYPKYVLRPFSGALLALVFYLVLRAGLTSTGNDTVEGYSIVFYAAIGTIVGMFTDQTVAKLKKIAEAILTTPDEPKRQTKAKTEIPEK